MSPEAFITKHGFPGTPAGERMAADLMEVMQNQVNVWSRHLLHTSMHNNIPIFLAGRLQDQANTMRAFVGLEPFGWGDYVLDAEFGECTIHADKCKGQETHG